MSWVVTCLAGLCELGRQSGGTAPRGQSYRYIILVSGLPHFCCLDILTSYSARVGKTCMELCRLSP
jgi:hypothetical protein